MDIFFCHFSKATPCNSHSSRILRTKEKYLTEPKRGQMELIVLLKSVKVLSINSSLLEKLIENLTFK